MAATREAINEILNSDLWSESEKWVVKWQFRLLGDFETALAKAIELADDSNLYRLHRGFPEQVEGFYAWSRDDLAERLRKAGLGI